MKKYLSLLIVCSLFFGFSFSQSLGIGENCEYDYECDSKYCQKDPGNLGVNGGICQDKINPVQSLNCSIEKQYTDQNNIQQCCNGIVENKKCIENTDGNMGIDINPDCLINGQCKFDIYETIGIKKSLPKETRSSPGLFIQDIILAATMFIGTLMTIVIIASGLLYVFSAADTSLAQKAKQGLTGAIIGLLMVSGSYAFIRLIQFLATGGGG